MEDLTGFGKKNSLTLTNLAEKYFDSLRGDKVQNYTYNNENMRSFVRQSMKCKNVQL